MKQCYQCFNPRNNNLTEISISLAVQSTLSSIPKMSYNKIIKFSYNVINTENLI